jgi:glutamate racemase
LGGLTVVRELSRVLPGEDFLYFGDTARVPYGIKSLETVRRFSFEIAAFLLKLSPKMIVVACNTASAAAVEALEAACPVEVVDVIRPGAAAALAATQGPIGVIATEATVASGAYERAIRAKDPNRQVIARACPLLVPIVEEGRSEDDPIVLGVLSDYLRELQRILPQPRFGDGGDATTGALILGCTHYPLLQNAIAKLMGPSVPLVSSGKAAALEVQRRLSLSGRYTRRGYGGRLHCFTTDNADRFVRLGERFGGRRIDDVQFVRTDELEAQGTWLLDAAETGIRDSGSETTGPGTTGPGTTGPGTTGFGIAGPANHDSAKLTSRDRKGAVTPASGNANRDSESGTDSNQEGAG